MAFVTLIQWNFYGRLSKGCGFERPFAGSALMS
jgi:hypothetical protein